MGLCAAPRSGCPSNQHRAQMTSGWSLYHRRNQCSATWGQPPMGSTSLSGLSRPCGTACPVLVPLRVPCGTTPESACRARAFRLVPWGAVSVPCPAGGYPCPAVPLSLEWDTGQHGSTGTIVGDVFISTPARAPSVRAARRCFSWCRAPWQCRGTSRHPGPCRRLGRSCVLPSCESSTRSCRPRS